MAPDGSRNHFYSSETVPMHMVQQPQKPGEAPMYKGPSSFNAKQRYTMQHSHPGLAASHALAPTRSQPPSSHQGHDRH